MKKLSFIDICNTLIVFVFSLVLWALSAVGLFIIFLNTDQWSNANSIYISIVVAAALAGFFEGFAVGSRFDHLHLVCGWLLLGMLLSLPYSQDPIIIPITLLVVPSLGLISCSRGVQLRRDKKIKHLIWLVIIVCLLLATNYVIRISHSW